MVVVSGVPIRLVQKNGALIPLYATSFTMGVTREVGSNPWLGGNALRVGVDMNITHHSIIIDLLFTDDTEYATAQSFTSLPDVVEARKAAGAIHFDNGYVVDDNGNLTGEKVPGIDAELYFHTDVNDPTSKNIQFQIQTQDRKAGLLTGTNGIIVIEINHTLSLTTPFLQKYAKQPASFRVSHDMTQVNGVPNWANITEAIVAVFDSGVSNESGGIDYSGYILVNGGDGNDIPFDAFEAAQIGGVNQTGVRITSKQGGSAINGMEFNFTELNTYRPETISFNGGQERNSSFQGNKSAGDKVQDLLGLVNNSYSGGFFAGLVTNLFGGGIFGGQGSQGSSGGYGTGGLWYSIFTSVFGLNEEQCIMPQPQFDDDYVIGIQIPYSSLLHSTPSIPNPVRNFFLTNGSIHPLRKGALVNTYDATNDFQPNASGVEKCGIEGVLADFDVTYNASESIYEGKLKFLPVEKLL